jgi:hypothetical protein
VASVLGDWTAWQDIAPNDGLRRQLKARHVTSGATASAYTAVVTVLPWTPIALQPYPTHVITSLVVTAPSSDANAQTKVVVTASAVDPLGSSVQVALTALTSNASISSGAAVGTYVASGSSWTINRPGILKGSAAAEFTGDTAPLSAARSTRTYLDIPEQGQQGAPVLALTVKEDGHVETKITGNSDTASYAYAESISGVPSDATARAGTLVNGRVVTITSSMTLVLGGRYFIKAVPYNAAVGAGGSEGQIVEGSVDRQNQTDSKTVRVNGLEFKAYPGGAGAYYDPASYLRPASAASGSYFAFIRGIPVGVPVTLFTVRLYRETGVGTVYAQAFRVDSSGVTHGPIGGTQVHSTSGWQTLSGSATDTSDGSDYLVQCVLDPTGEPSADSVRIAWANLDYTATDLSKSGAG